MFSLHDQYVDSASGFHVIELRDGKEQHMVQISVGAGACPACGRLHPKDNLGELDPRALVGEVSDALNLSRQNILAYAKKHGLTLK